jgi:hypothetical protein
VGANQQDNGITRIEKAGSERELLSLFLSKLQKLDPDIIIGEFARGSCRDRSRDFFQDCGSAFISAGSGSSILG